MKQKLNAKDFILIGILTALMWIICMIMRCLKVTDELAASGTTRGLELECKRYALRPIRFAWPEIVVSLLGILFLVGLLFIDQTQIGKIILWRV